MAARGTRAALGLAALSLVACGPTGTDRGIGDTDAGTAGVDVSRANGEMVFWIGGCASCHASEGPLSATAPRLGGGRAIVTRFGTFHAPNISPDPETGIGGWSLEEFDRAMREGVAPDGHAYYPTFPYPSYARMTRSDIADLHVYLTELPTVNAENRTDRLPFPANLPGAAESWRRLNLRPGPVEAVPEDDSLRQRGRYLVEGPGHCGSCHTPRDPLGGPRLGRWLAGAKLPDGSGFAPNLTPHEDGLAGWTAEEIVETLHPGDLSDGGYEGMAAARYNVSRLPEQDLKAIAAYLIGLQPRATPASELD